MSESNHDLGNEFPAMKQAIHELKMQSPHFRQLMERYYELNKSIHRAEQRIEVISELAEENLRKQRLQLKDEIYSMLVKHSAEKHTI